MAVEDYLSDREQEEALRNWWRENWRWIVGGIVLGIGLLAGWQYWRHRVDQQAVAAAELYRQLQEIPSAEAEKSAAVLKQLEEQHAGSAYLQQARLLQAKTLVEASKYDEAVAVLRTVVDDADDPQLAHIARLRLARVLIQLGQHDAALQALPTEAAGEFAAQVREVRGDALFAKGDAAGARAEYAAALAANVDDRIDRSLLEMKLQQVGGSEPSVSEAVAQED